MNRDLTARLAHLCRCGRRLWKIKRGPFAFTICPPCDLSMG